MVDLKDFLYELNQFTSQAHTLKDAYEKLNESEKQFVKDYSPATAHPPDVMFENTVELVRALNKQVTDD